MTNVTTKEITLFDFISNFNNPVLAMMPEGAKKGMDYIHKPFNEVEKNLQFQNDNKAAIFFMPNGRAMGKGAKTEHCTHYDYIVFDTDINKEEALSKINEMESLFKIKSSFIVETNRGYHVYYRLSDPLLNDKGDTSYRIIYETLGKMINADLQCKNINRVFRLPGYKYINIKKGGITNVDFTVQLIKYNPESIVDTLKLKDKVYNLNKTLKDNNEVINQSHREFGGGEIFRDINNLSIVDVVESLGRFEIRGIDIIDQNAEHQHGWKINKSANYVVNFSTRPGNSWRPEGSPWAFIRKYFNGNTEHTFRYFETKFNINRNSYKKERIEKTLPVDDDIEMYESLALRMSLIINKTQMTMSIEGSKFSQQISDFYIEPVATIINDSGKVNKLIKFIGKGGKTDLIPFPNESSINLFVKKVREMGLFNFTGKVNAVDIIVEFINSKVFSRQLHENTTLGINSRGSFISNTFIMYMENGVVVTENVNKKGGIAGNEYINISNVTDKPIYKISSKYDNDVIEQIKIACSIYKEEIMLPLILTAITGLIAKQLREIGYSVPYAFLFGLTQSGKTTISNIVKERLLGDYGRRLSAVSTTPLPLQLASAHNKSMFIGEFRSEDKRVQEKFFDFLRNMYDGAGAERGRANLTIETYDLNANAIIDGENIISDPATFSRGIFLHCKSEYKKHITNKVKLYPCIKNLYKILYETGIATVNNDDEIENFNNKYNKFLEKYSKLIRKRGIDSGESDRVIDNFSLISAVGETIGLGSEYIYNVLVSTLTNQVEKVARGSAKQKMLNTLLAKANMTIRDTGNDIVFITEKIDGDFVLTIRLIYVYNFHEKRRMDAHKLDSAIEALNGEPGIKMEGLGKIKINISKAKLDEDSIDMINSGLEIQKNCGNMGAYFYDFKNLLNNDEQKKGNEDQKRTQETNNESEIY